MESQVSPSSIQDRAESLTASTEKETADAAAAEAAKVASEKVAADAAAAAEAAKDGAGKPAAEGASVAKGEEARPKMPNDPAELRKWATKASQESAALRDEVKSLKTAIEKLSKKPIDYKELAKNPEAIQKQIELERQEAIAEMQDKLQEATTKAVAQETTVEKIRREQDTVNYPEWKRVFPLIQNLAQNTDGRINFNQRPSDVLDALYELALQLSPVVAPAAAAPAPGKSDAEKAAEAKAAADKLQADIEAAEKRGFEKAQAALKNEQAGAGIGSAGTGGRRTNGTTKEALAAMPLEDLKKLITKP